MTHVYPDSLRGANYAFLLLILFLPVFSHADSTGNYDEDPSYCCDSFDYWIKFPKDAVGDCALPDAGDVEVQEGYCDLLAVSKVDKVFNVPGSSNCYKIFRTFGVVNWCEYVDGADPVVVGRDEDCDGKPGDEDIYVLVQTMYGHDPCEYDNYGYYSHSQEYQHVWYDRDTDPYNNNPAPETKGYHCDYESNPKGSWKEITDNTDDYAYMRDHCEMASVGYWQYTQVIKVTDYDKPEISFTAPDPFCSYSSDTYSDCPGQVSLAFSVQEDCSPEDVTVSAYFDQYADGDADWEVTDALSGSYPDFGISTAFPLGSHELIVKADDGCGNVGVVRIPFEVVDCKGPSPICINGLAIKLMPVIPAADVDGDGDEDEGAMELWASDFVTSQIFDCTGPITYSVNRSGEEVDIDQTNIMLTCDDDAVTVVEVHAWDGNGNNDYCITYVQVQSEDGLCPADVPGASDPEEEEEEAEEAYTGETGTIAGRIATEYEMPVGGVMVHRMSTENEHQMSDVLGAYQFGESPMHDTYLIEPEANNNWLEGVTISDLHLLKKYLMGLAELDSPYKMLAADLDGSGSITEEDLDLLWSLFLFQTTELESAQSWRFVPADYVFPNEEDPFAEAVPHNILIEDLAAPMTDLSFIAVKMGDFNESIRPGSEARTALDQFAFQLPDLKLQAGETRRVDIRARDLAIIDAYQMSLAFDPDQIEVVEVLERAAGTQQVALQHLKDGLIHTAWHRPLGDEALENAVVLSLLLHAKTEVALNESLQLTKRGLPAEAVGVDSEMYELALEFETVSAPVFAVEQNQPNPFRTTTQIRYFLPEASEVNLRITDVHGKILREIRTDGFAGENVLNLSRKDLASGILFYTLSAGDQSLTKKMLLVK